MPLRLLRDVSAFISSVEGDIEGMLGWSEDDLVGSPSTELIHPQDQASAVATWMEMISAPGETFRWRGRYRAADGHWVWVESENTNLLDDAGVAAVVTVLREVEAGDLSIEEQLRAREQLLDRLADALPVGLIQFDASRSVVFTNQRLEDILGTRVRGAAEDVVALAADEDSERLASAIDATFDHRPVDDLEVRFGLGWSREVCSLSFRTLTDAENVVTGAIGCVLDVTARAQLHGEMEVRAETDALTRCANRGSIVDLLSRLLHEAAEHSGVGVVFIDLDRFKALNDSYGHAVGDAVLVSTADGLRSAVRDADVVGRFGGDEFLIVCPRLNGAEEAKQIGERAVAAIAGGSGTLQASVEITASVGVAYQDHPGDADTLIDQADRAMYTAKSGQSPSPCFTDS